MLVMLLCQPPYNTIELPQQKSQLQASIQGAGRRLMSPAVQSTPTALVPAVSSQLQSRDAQIASIAEDLLLKFGGEPKYESIQRNFVGTPGPTPQVCFIFSIINSEFSIMKWVDHHLLQKSNFLTSTTECTCTIPA
jgi:hypothetical protein